MVLLLLLFNYKERKDSKWWNSLKDMSDSLNRIGERQGIIAWDGTVMSYVQRRAINTPVRKGELIQVERMKKVEEDLNWHSKK